MIYDGRRIVLCGGTPPAAASPPHARTERIVEASGKPARIKHIPLFALRAMSALARPFSPPFARQAGPAVMMNTMDMSWSPSKTADGVSVAEQKADPRA